MIAVTSGLGMDTHEPIQESVGNRYPVTMSPAVATGHSPANAFGTATELLQEVRSAQDQHCREILRGRTIDEQFREPDDIQIVNFDINDATGRYTNELDEFDTFVRTEQGYAALVKHMREAHDALSVF